MSREYKIKLDASKFTVTDQGFLQCQANLTKTGVFTYTNPDTGKPVRELRCDEEVFNPVSLASLKLAPITFKHPGGMVTSNTVTAELVGTVGEHIKRDGEFVTSLVQIVHEPTVKDVLDRKQLGMSAQLSCGYKAREDCTPGIHPVYGKYDLIQRDIRYNHVSLVPAGRAGPEVCLKLDNKTKEKTTMLRYKKDGVHTSRFTMDSIEAEVPEEASGILDRLSGKLDEAIAAIDAAGTEVTAKQSELDALQGKFDALTEDHKKATDEVKELNDPSSPKIVEMIKAQTKLDEACKYFNIDTKGLKSPIECKKAVVLAYSPKCDLADKSEEYVNARFDAAAETIGVKEANNKKVADVRSVAHADAGGELSPRDRFIRDSKKRGK